MIKRARLKKSLITGVCGLIGSHLLDELLKHGHDVIGIDDLSYGKKENISRYKHHPRFKFHRFDICDTRRLSRLCLGVKNILHMAAVKKIGETDLAERTLHVNAFGTQSVMEAARTCGAQVIVGSTSDVYGRSSKIPFSEEDDCVIGPSTAKRWAYAVSKLYAEQIAMCYHKDFGVPIVILRYFGCFSERSSTSWSGGHVPIFIDKILTNQPLVIHGDGKQTRSMAHVSDIVRGTILAMNSPRARGQIINLGNDEEMSVVQCAKIIHRISGSKRPLKIRYIPIRKIFGDYKEIARRVPDLRKARKLLGYRPLVSFENAIRMAIANRRKSLC